MLEYVVSGRVAVSLWRRRSRGCRRRTDYPSGVAKIACLLVLALIAAGCGSSKATPPSSPPQPGPGKVVFQGSEWAVVVDGGKATAQHLVGDTWKPAARGTVKIRVLGPKPGSKGNAASRRSRRS